MLALVAPGGAPGCGSACSTFAVADDLIAAAGHRHRLHRAPEAARAGDRPRAVPRPAGAALRAARLAAPGRGAALGVGMVESPCSTPASTRSSPGSRSAWSPAPTRRERAQLEQVTELTRSFREQPTPELARSAQLGVASAISPNERLQHRLHPWTSYLIVPLFALANAGIHVDGGVAARRDPLAADDRHRLRLGARQAAGDRRRLLAGVAATARRHPPGAELAVDRRRRDRLRDRLHRRDPGRRPGLRRRAARRGETRGAGRRRPGLVRRLVGLPPDRPPAAAGAGAPGRGHERSDPRSLRRHRPGPRPRPRRRRRDRHPDRVRRLRVPLLRPGRGRDPRAARVLRRRPALRLAAPAAERRPPARPVAAEATEAAHAQGAFWELHDTLLATRTNWRRPT